MDLYKIIISPKALSQLEDYVSYIQYTLLDSQAAENVWQDAVDTRDRLELVAGSLQLCANKELRELGYHIIRFQKHRYLMLYRIDGDRVYVDAIYHELQNFKDIFLSEFEN